MLTIDIETVRGPVCVTAAYFLLWYTLLLGLQRGTKYRLLAEYARRGEQFDRYFGRDGRMLAADRAVANTHEQMVPFLVAMWLFALLVSPFWATFLGSVYIALRALYPFLLGKSVERTQSKRVFIATGPGYLIVFTMLATSVWAALAG